MKHNVAYASKLRRLLNYYYLESRNVSDFDRLFVRDRIKTTLSESDLKYILSTENSRDDGWLTVKDLTESIDRFVAAKDDAFKPRAYAIGQTPYKPIQKPPSDFVRPKADGHTSKPGTDAPKSATNVTTTPRKHIMLRVWTTWTRAT